MKSHREYAVICGGGTDPPLLLVENQKKKNTAVQSIPAVQSQLSKLLSFLPFYLPVDRFGAVSGDMFQPHSNKLVLCMYILVLNLTLICSLILLQVLTSSPFLIYSPLELLLEEIGEEILF